jgi:hypothetical protein
MFMRWRGINIDNNLFELRFNEPQNFAKYRQVEVDAARIQAFSSLEGVPYLSKRFLLERYLDLSEEELQRNDELWVEENSDESTKATSTEAGLRAVNVNPAGIESDTETFAPPPESEEGAVDISEPGSAGLTGQPGAPTPSASPIGSVPPTSSTPPGL